MKNYISNCYVISSENCPGYEDSTDDWHFSSEGYRELGRHYAQTMLDILANQKPEDPNASIPVNNSLFDFSKFTSDLSGEGSGTWNADNKELQTKQDGVGGWSFTPAIDMTAYKYLVVEFEEAPTTDTRLAMYSSAYSVFEDSYTQYYSSDKRIVFEIQKEGGYTTSKWDGTTGTLDLTSIKLLGIQTNGQHVVKIKNIYVTNELNEPDPEEPTPVEDLFKLDASSFKKMSGHEITTVEFKESKAIVKNAGSYGVVGWDFSTSPVNLEGKGYLVVELSEYITELPWIVICDKGLYGEGYRTESATEKEGKYYVVLSLDSDPTSNISPNDGTEKDNSIDLSNLTYVGLQSGTSENELPNGGYTVDKVYFSPTNPLEQ